MTTDKPARLKAVLEAYGADPARWPEADRVALADVLENGGELAAEQLAAGELDKVLAAASMPASPHGARARLAALAETAPQAQPVPVAPQTVHALGIGRFAAASTLAASLLIGAFVGTLGTLDPILIGEGDPGIWSEASGFDDPFDLDSLLGSNDEGAG